MITDNFIHKFESSRGKKGILIKKNLENLLYAKTEIML